MKTSHLKNKSNLTHICIKIIFFQSLKKFNAMLTGNADLRQEIDSLRVERKRFEGMHKKLDKELTSLRTQINEEIDASTMAYDSR